MLLLAQSIGVSGQAQQSKRFLTGPLTIEDQGSFFIGGVPKMTDAAGRPPAALPAPPAATAPAPNHHRSDVRAVPDTRAEERGLAGHHGARVRHTGACLESTPDGREGWYPYFVRNGVASYVVDQAGRGRSGFDQSSFTKPKPVRNGDANGEREPAPRLGSDHGQRCMDRWFGHLLPAGSTILKGTVMPHRDPADPFPRPESSPTDPAVSDRS